MVRPKCLISHPSVFSLYYPNGSNQQPHSRLTYTVYSKFCGRYLVFDMGQNNGRQVLLVHCACGPMLIRKTQNTVYYTF